MMSFFMTPILRGRCDGALPACELRPPEAAAIPDGAKAQSSSGMRKPCASAHDPDRTLRQRPYTVGTSPPHWEFDGQQVPCPGVRGRVAQLRHRPRLDLADALPGQVEVLAHLLERPGLAPVQPEAQAQDLTLPLVERREQAADLVGQQRHRRHLEG